MLKLKKGSVLFMKNSPYGKIAVILGANAKQRSLESWFCAADSYFPETNDLVKGVYFDVNHNRLLNGETNEEG